MKLGISMNFTHTTPEEWAEKHKMSGLSAVVFPCDYTTDVNVIDRYVQSCHSCGLTIAEVGAWVNLMSPDEKQKSDNFEYCVKQLELAEYTGASCCVNIAGAKGKIWDGAYADNYSEKTYAEIIDCVQRLIDRVNPQKTFYTLEPMPWMYPDSPQSYLQMIKDINRNAFGVHMDMVNMISTPQKYLFNTDFTNEAFDILQDYIKSCHVKDVLLDTSLTVRLSEVPCGHGGFNIRNYFERIDGISPDLPVIIEHLASEREYLNAINYIKNLM